MLPLHRKMNLVIFKFILLFCGLSLAQDDCIAIEIPSNPEVIDLLKVLEALKEKRNESQSNIPALQQEDKMKLFLPAAIMYMYTLALALIPGLVAVNPNPCELNTDNNAYNKFVRKHILQDPINTGSTADWERYLYRYGLCNRPRQSFMRKTDESLVVQTCNGYGIRLSNNLCTSTSDMLVYDLRVNTGNCKVTYLQERMRYVVLACDKVINQCLPVHYEKVPTTHQAVVQRAILSCVQQLLYACKK